MNRDDQYQAWLKARRSESPPAEMADRIMPAVREPAPQMESAQRTAWQRVIPYLVCSAAALVLSLRLYSIASLLFVSSPDIDVSIIESIEESSHEP